MYLKYFLFIGYISVSTLYAQSNHTILTYNLLNYEDEDDRESTILIPIINGDNKLILHCIIESEIKRRMHLFKWNFHKSKKLVFQCAS